MIYINKQDKAFLGLFNKQPSAIFASETNPEFLVTTIIS